jgi:hypothetical protein
VQKLGLLQYYYGRSMVLSAKARNQIETVKESKKLNAEILWFWLH